MPIIKKAYSYSRKRQIWRLIPSGTNKLVIEERDASSKEVYFNCIDINTGKKIFYDYQLDEKHWTGIETVYNDIIIFHKYASRDMPDHIGLTAFDINTKKIIWSTDEYIYLFILEDKIYGYTNNFEGRDFYLLDIRTGSLLENLGNDANRINSLRQDSFNPQSGGNYLFPEIYYPEIMKETEAGNYFEQLKTGYTIAGRIEFITNAGLLFFNFHEVLKDGSLKNIFKAIEFSSKKVILEEILNLKTNVFIPDCFFIKDNLLFLLLEKVKLKVCSIKK